MPEEEHQPKTQLPEIIIGVMVTLSFDAVEAALFLFGIDDFLVADILFGGTILAYTFLRGLPPVPNLAGTGIESIPYVGGLFPGRTVGFLIMVYTDHNPKSKLATAVQKVTSFTTSFKGGAGATVAARPPHAPTASQRGIQGKIRSTQEEMRAKAKSQKVGAQPQAATGEKIPKPTKGQEPTEEKAQEPPPKKEEKAPAPQPATEPAPKEEAIGGEEIMQPEGTEQESPEVPTEEEQQRPPVEQEAPAKATETKGETSLPKGAAQAASEGEGAVEQAAAPVEQPGKEGAVAQTAAGGTAPQRATHGGGGARATSSAASPGGGGEAGGSAAVAQGTPQGGSEEIAGGGGVMPTLSQELFQEVPQAPQQPSSERTTPAASKKQVPQETPQAVSETSPAPSAREIGVRARHRAQAEHRRLEERQAALREKPEEKEAYPLTYGEVAGEKTGVEAAEETPEKAKPIRKENVVPMNLRKVTPPPPPQKETPRDAADEGDSLKKAA